MDLEIKVHSDHVDIIITGTIKTISNAHMIKEAIHTTHEQYPGTIINLIIQNSFIITSSVIGFVIKSIQLDKIALHVNVGSEELYTMLEDMNLIEMMNVRKAYTCAKA